MRRANLRFKFPFKLTDRVSDRYNELLLEKQMIDSLEDPATQFDVHDSIQESDWMVVIGSVEVEDIKFWHEYNSGTKSVEEAFEEGCDSTLLTLTGGYEFVCTWPLKKFEEKYNQCLDKIAKWEEENAPEEEYEEDEEESA